jgi:RNAse (barnase) inhibitor barstar
MRQYEIDGRRTNSLGAFFAEFSRVLLPGVSWGQNLDALDDVLYGGFGTPDEGFAIRWLCSSEARKALGYAETIRQLEFRLAHCDPSYRGPVERELSLAKANIGPTVFDWLVKIIRSHRDIRLVLD